jgi:uncharacterized protein YbaA (DUF1428 family)
LKPLKLSDGETRATISGNPLRSELQEALARYERAARPAELSQLLKALAVLAAMTIRQDQAEHGVVVEATRAYAEALSRFPGDIALTVVQTWPSRENGRWWPTLHDLIAACQDANAERVAAQDALRSALRDSRPGDDGAGPVPIGATARFRERVAAARGEAYAFSWLNRRNCRFTADTVLTTNFAAQRLLQDVGTIADECGVEIMEGARYATDGEHGDAEPAPVRRVRPPKDDEIISDQERAEMADVLRAMAAKMRRANA